MKGTIRTTVVAICALVITLFMASCSKDDNNEKIEDKNIELTKEQFLEARSKVLNSIPGSYKGLISADAKNQGLSGNIKWDIYKDGIVVCKNFPYEALAFGISTEDNSSEATQLRAALIEVPLADLKFRLVGNQESKDPADLYATPRITTKIKTSQGTYQVDALLLNDILNAHYDIKTSNLKMKFIINRLFRLIEHQDGRIEYKQEKKFSIPVDFELRTIEKKEIQ
ncbi:DUF4840 domain-containing protein [Prevotella melaninogenica]|uniref:DUF4840 domain-containing protein n=1 Tax=Prevotella melaninogenica TaxID=28132 RepID=A0A250KL99_9BACT|nr:DUF4840 domain-containing protein [Prevotella melaninogenica]BBA28603.1 hypothetical protein PMEL1_00507 [Prevotella melaninogenica]